MKIKDVWDLSKSELVLEINSRTDWFEKHWLKVTVLHRDSEEFKSLKQKGLQLSRELGVLRRAYIFSLHDAIVKNLSYHKDLFIQSIEDVENPANDTIVVGYVDIACEVKPDDN